MEPRPVKRLCLLLHPADEPAEVTRALEAELEAQFGPIDFRGPDHLFDSSAYYMAEMGGALVRRLLTFGMLAAAEDAPEWKRTCIAIETRHCQPGTDRRQANLDIGYLDPDKLVFPSTKGGPHKLYVGDGIWLDMQLRWVENCWHNFWNTFPDIASGTYHRELAIARQKYKAGLRRLNLPES